MRTNTFDECLKSAIIYIHCIEDNGKRCSVFSFKEGRSFIGLPILIQ